MTKTMKERVEVLGGKWESEGGGYHSLIVQGPYAQLAYVALPENHPDVESGIFDDSIFTDLDVNGGVTYARGNVFGWDYGHAYNSSNPHTDILNALSFFRGRER